MIVPSSALSSLLLWQDHEDHDADDDDNDNDEHGDEYHNLKFI